MVLSVANAVRAPCALMRWIMSQVLVDDYECVFEEQRLVPIPRRPCVADLMEQYVAQASSIANNSYIFIYVYI